MASVLLVVFDPAALSANDVALRDRIQALGHTVTLQDDDAAVPANVGEYGLIILAGGNATSSLKYRDVAVPVMAFDRTRWRELEQSFAHSNYINPNANSSFNTNPLVSIVDPVHPLAGGLAAGQHSVYTYTDTVLMVVTAHNNYTPAAMQRVVGHTAETTAIFGYEAGAAMWDGVVAPARRVGFGLATIKDLNANGVTLFNAAVEWARRKVAPLPGFTVTTSDRTVTCTSQASDPDGTIAKTEYDFGDGSGFGTAATHTYASYGAYVITQRVTDNDGMQATDTFNVSLGNLGRATPEEYDLWASGSFVTHLDVQIERLVGGIPTLQSYRSFGGWNWIRSLRLQPAQVDTPIGSGTLTLHRARGGQNLSPLVVGSSLNKDGASYAPALDFGREIRVYTACMPTDTTVTTSAPAAVNAVSVSVAALTRAVAAGSVIHFPTGEARVSATAAAGALSIAVQPLPAAVPAGTEAPVSHEPGAGDWRAIFEGVTDDIEWGGRDRGAVEVPFRDRSGTLADTYVRDATVYGSEAGTPIEVAAQQIVDGWMGAGQYPIAVRPVAPAFRVTRYEVSEVSVWEALEKLADQPGAALRQAWNEAAGEERLTIITPPRDKEAPDYAVTPATYLEAHQVGTGGKNLRNVVRVLATDGSTGKELTYQVPAEANVKTDPSVLQYGPRFLQIPEEEASAIDTQAELVAFGDSIYADVSNPPIPLEMETRFCWFAEPDQMIRWMANTVLWDQDMDSAVLGVSHDFPSPGVGRTRWRTAGKPKGAWAAWIRKGAGFAGRNARPPRAAGFYNLTDVKLIANLATATHFAMGWTAGVGVTVVRGAALMFQSGSANSDEAKNAVINAAVPVVAPLMVPKPSRPPQFSLAMVQAGWISPTGVEVWGERWWYPVQPPPAFAPSILTLDVEGQKIKAVGQNTGSWTFTRINPPVGGEYSVTLDGGTVTVDLAAVMGSADTWRVECRAYNDPAAERDSDTISVAEERTVRGPTAPVEKVISDIVLTAPTVGDDLLTVTVSTAVAQPTYTMLADTRWWYGNDLPTEWMEGVATTPALGAPNGGTQTVTIDTGHTRSGANADGSEMTVNYEVRIRVQNGSDPVDSLARVRSWYTTAPAPT